MTFKLVMVIYTAASIGSPQIQENVTGGLDLRAQMDNAWQTVPDNQEFPDLAACKSEADRIHELFKPVNDLNRWRVSIQCRSEGSICEWLPDIYPGGVIPPGSLPDSIQEQYDAECSET